MRKPNGYGTIKKLSGNRRRPFVFLVSKNGRQKPVEYFTSQIEAEIYQADYNKIHHNRSLGTESSRKTNYLTNTSVKVYPTIGENIKEMTFFVVIGAY